MIKSIEANWYRLGNRTVHLYKAAKSMDIMIFGHSVGTMVFCIGEQGLSSFVCDQIILDNVPNNKQGTGNWETSAGSFRFHALFLEVEFNLQK